MAAEEILKLFDSFWFEHGLFATNPAPPPPPSIPSPPPPLRPPSSAGPAAQTVRELEEEEEEEEEEPKLSRLPTMLVRSRSDQFLSSNTSFASDLHSPNSVLHSPKLLTILSGKEVGEFSEQVAKQAEAERPAKKKSSDWRRRRKGSSKSLSDLEFEELKGFMDLGFVFSEEDKDSSLVSILPGLQRLGREGEEEEEEEEKEGAVEVPAVSRPYLSEAWGVLDRRTEKSPLMNWRIPSPGNEINMKDNLRFWAQTVASTVK
ncbi:uncharacterized protein LOC131148204 [Malania oleifera]|uniref:uncharacterized protein LOC131148204 n=1 Tax=Malania oleifera TaxID=397392 RepID=UPI0025AD9DB0|nr:uncharacterized protein LOC131148204 [Malania oleifera]